MQMCQQYLFWRVNSHRQQDHQIDAHMHATTYIIIFTSALHGEKWY